MSSKPVPVAATLMWVALGPVFGVSGLAQAGDASDSGCFGDFRYRFEWVDEDGFDNNARASTLLTRLACRAALGDHVEVMAEGSSVLALGPERYNPVGDPSRAGFPVVADPEESRLARFSLRWLVREGVELGAGRHRIKLDNDRFIGNVGWRQNEQTFDSVQFRVQREKWSVFYAYVDQVNRIFDQDLPIGRQDHRSHLLNAALQVADGHRLIAYRYDIDNRDAPSAANTTTGLRYLGAGKWLAVEFDWLAEFADQQDTGRAEIAYSADYFHVQTTAAVHPTLRARAGFERLEGSSNAGQAFRTPLATLHAFNGWADRFLTIPDRGLEDFYLALLGQVGPVDWQLKVHEFRSEVGTQRYGREIDASMAFPIVRDMRVLLKAARFIGNSDAPFGDATKLWAQLSWAWD
jgi:hypothetical protein